jgi:hypothetical protein
MELTFQLLRHHFVKKCIYVTSTEISKGNIANIESKITSFILAISGAALK